MKTHLEVTIVLRGPVDMVFGEAQKVFDSCCEIDPVVLSHVDFDYCNLFEKTEEIV